MSTRLLIIEDEAPVLNNLVTLLKHEGFLVYGAENGDLGIKIAKELKPDLIICDIMMPNKNGYEVLSELSNDPKTHLIPFLFLTAKVDLADFRKGMELGADDYLFKPYKADELLKAIKVRLDKYKRIDSKQDISSKLINENDNEISLDELLFFNINGKPIFINTSSIVFITSENQYSKVNLKNGLNYLFKKPLRSWEETLPEKSFVRIHRSTIININYVRKHEPSNKSSLEIYLADVENPFQISRRYCAKLKTRL